MNRTPQKNKTWESKVLGWKEYARSKGLVQDIDFKWWGFTELHDGLVKPENRELLVYWLNVPEFSFQWLEKVNEIRIKGLGPRYSKGLHVETDTGRRVNAFAHTGLERERIIESYLALHEAVSDAIADYEPDEIPDKAICEKWSEFLATGENRFRLHMGRRDLPTPPSLSWRYSLIPKGTRSILPSPGAVGSKGNREVACREKSISSLSGRRSTH